MWMGKVVDDPFLRMMNIEIIKGITHAHPAIWRPKIENSAAAAAIKVEITTIQIIKGTSILLNFITLKLIIYIS